MATLDQLRELFPHARSDEDLIGLAAKDLGLDPATVANDVGYSPGSGSLTGERVSGAVDNYQSGLYETLGLGARAVGLRGVSDWARGRAADNKFSADVAGARGQALGGIDSYKEVTGAGSGLNYLGGLVAQSLPYAAEAAVGGLVGRGVSGGLRAASLAGRATGAAEDAIAAGRAADNALSTRGLIGGTAASYPSSVGDILGNQLEQNGTTNDGYAALMGAPYAALNALGETGVLARGRLNPLRGGSMDLLTGVSGGLRRAGVAGARVAGEEALSEVSQELINQGGRVAVDPTRASMFSPEALDRYGESAVGGGALGLVFGAGGNRGRRSDAFTQRARDVALPLDPAPGDTLQQLGFDPAVRSPNEMVSFPDGTTLLRSEYEATFGDRPGAVPPGPAPVPFTPGMETVGAQAIVSAQQQKVQEQIAAAEQEQARQDQIGAVLAKYGEVQSAPLEEGGTQTAHRWLGNLHYTPEAARGAIAKQVQADARRISEHGGNAAVINEAELAYADAYREQEAERAARINDASDPKAAARPVRPSTLKANEFTKLVQGVQSVPEVAARVRAEIAAEDAKGETKANGDRVGVLQKFLQRLTPDAATAPAAPQTATETAAPISQPTGDINGAQAYQTQQATPKQQQEAPAVAQDPARYDGRAITARIFGPNGKVSMMRTFKDAGAMLRDENTPEPTRQAILAALAKEDAAKVTHERLAKEVEAAQSEQFANPDAFSQWALAKVGASPEQIDVFNRVMGYDKYTGDEQSVREAAKEAAIGKSSVGALVQSLREKIKPLELLHLTSTRDSQIESPEERANREATEASLTQGEQEYGAEVQTSDDVGVAQATTDAGMRTGASKGRGNVGVSADAQSGQSVRNAEAALAQGGVDPETGLDLVAQEAPAEEAGASTRNPDDTPLLHKLWDQYNAAAIKAGDLTPKLAVAWKSMTQGSGHAAFADALGRSPEEAMKVHTSLTRMINEAGMRFSKAETPAWGERVTPGVAFYKGPLTRVTDRDAFGRENPGWVTAAAQLKARGLGDALRGIDDIMIAEDAAAFTDGGAEVFGAIHLNSQSGRVELWLNRSVLANPNRLAYTVRHELGHYIDGAFGLKGLDTYSALPAMDRHGAVTRELIREFDNLHEEAQRALNVVANYDDATLRKEEMFAELVALATNPEVRSTLPPLTLKFIDKAIAHANRNWKTTAVATKIGGLQEVSRLAHGAEQTSDHGVPRNARQPVDPGVRGGDRQARLAPGTRFSQATTQLAQLSQKLLAWVQQVRSPRADPVAVVLATAPPVYRMLGFTRPIAIDVEHARHTLNKHPEITPQDFAALPDLLTRPRAVIADGEGINAIVDARDGKGNPLRVSLNPDKWTSGKQVLKVTEVSTLFGAEDSATYVARAAWENRLLYMPKKEIARLQALQSAASISAKEGGTPHDTLGSDLKTIVLSDEALAKFRENPEGNWATLTVPVKADSTSPRNLAGMRFSKSPAYTQVADVARRMAGGSGRSLVDTALHGIKKAATSLASLHDLVDEYKSKIPAVSAWYKSVLNTLTTRRKLETEAETIAAAADRLKGGTDRVNDFLSRSTFEQKWGYGPKADPAMAQLFNRLSLPEQTVVRGVFERGEKMIAYKYALLKKLGLSGTFNMGTGKLDGPYAPLKRFGNYVGLLKSEALVAAEQQGDKERVSQLRANPEDYVVSYFDTMGRAKQFAEANRAKFALADAFEKSTRVGEQRPMSSDVLQRVLSAVGMDNNMPEGAREAMTKLVKDMYFQSVDEHHARTTGLQRLNRAGYDTDMVRSFLANARSESAFLANLEHGGETNSAFYLMQRQVKDPATGARVHQDAFNVLADHYAETLKYSETPWQDRAMAFTSAMQLATSVGYHVANAMQGVMVTVPKLAADFNNYGGAWTHLLAGYGVLKHTGMWGKVDLSKVKDPGLRAALQQAADMGVLDVGMEEDLGRFDRTRTGIAAIDKTSGAAAQALHLLRQVSRAVETANRISSATAGYSMSIEAGKTKEQAQEYAVRLLQTTQGDYSRVGAPLLIKKIPKMVTQYRKYQFMMAALYAKGARDAFTGATPEVKAVGRRLLAFKLFHTSMAAGLLGMPMANVVGMVFAALGGDDSEPADLERWLRESGMPDWALHGPVTYMGLDKKLGEDKIFSIMPYGTWDLSSARGLTDTIAGLAGPGVSQAKKMADGVGAMARGDYYRGLEKFMPKGVADGMKAFRVANQGYSLKNGDVMFAPEDISGFALTLDSLGMASTEMKRMDWLRSQQYEVTRFFTERSRAIEHEYAAAKKEGDSETAAQLSADWMDLQAGKRNLRSVFGDSSEALRPQPLSTLLRYPYTVRERERKLQRAVPAGD